MKSHPAVKFSWPVHYPLIHVCQISLRHFTVLDVCVSVRGKKMKMDLSYILNVLGVTHVLCTPSLWNSVDMVTSNKNTTLLSSIGGDNARHD